MNDLKTFFLKPNSLLTFPPEKRNGIILSSPESKISYKIQLTDKYKIIEKIGTGTWSEVYSGLNKKNNEKVAIKKIRKIKISTDKMRDQIQREINIQKNLKHPNIIELYEAFEDDYNIHLVLEYAEKGELFYELQSRHPFSESKSAMYITDICKGADYCHKSNVIHRDIKAENILISSDGHLKLGDFGWSIKTLSKCNSFCGTLEYLSPQLLMGESYGCDCDIWSIGILLHEMLCGRSPFKERHSCDEDDLYWLVLREEIVDKKISLDSKNISKDAKDLLERLLQKDVEDRITMSEIFMHSWIIKNLVK